MPVYVFWHYPQAQIEPSLYEEALARFHEALKAASPGGFVRSSTYRIQEVPWLPVTKGYEDWYEVEDSAALDPLDQAAVSGVVGPAHEAIARLAEGGWGGLYRLLAPGVDPGEDSICLWLTKPRGMPYAEFTVALEEGLPAGWAIWQRQMVLGPAPEFCVVGAARKILPLQVPEDWEPQIVHRRLVWPATG